MKILIAAHKPIDSRTPRGGEKSVRIIAEYLERNGHEIEIHNGVPKVKQIQRCDIALTWGRPAVMVAKRCKDAGCPMVLMVRFWKNIAPPLASGGYGDLLKRSINPTFVGIRRPLFRYASRIITNTKYSRAIIHRWQPASKGKVRVSYVPITGEYNPVGRKDGHLTIITPEVYGEHYLADHITRIDPDQQILVVNCTDERQKMLFADIGPNVTACGYRDLSEVWPNTSVFLNPIYNNDICGTRRTTIEAVRHGVPVLCLDRCGVSEKMPAAMLVAHNATAMEWVAKIWEMQGGYGRFRRLARNVWEQYDTESELQKFENILEDVIRDN